jgi:hypothetical protein
LVAPMTMTCLLLSSACAKPVIVHVCMCMCMRVCVCVCVCA